MNERLFSLCIPCPDGFTLCDEFRTRDFRRAPFALHAPSAVAAREFLGPHLPHLAGIVLIPGDHLAWSEEAPFMLLCTIPPALLGSCLAEFAAGHLQLLDRRIGIEERCAFLTLENERLELNNQRAAEEFSRFRTGLLREVEERRAAEKQLLHVQKLESLGVLAGGIAHDFNNILMAIIGNADLALMRIHKESPAVDNLHKIEHAAAKAADLAKQMLAYSGKGRFFIESIDLNLLLEEMIQMLEVSISRKAALRLNLSSPLPPVEADAAQMRQIVMNLVINASEALDNQSGRIDISTGCRECDRDYLNDVWLDSGLPEGAYVFLEIRDSGCGMDRETMTKLFDPFFTTKFTGRGLGMAAVLGIVRSHKGGIKVSSEPGIGTTFTILLPASGKPAQLCGEPAGNDWHGNGLVLLVDDEESVRSIGSDMLTELGHTVITAADGLEALDLFKQNPDISLVILDLTMPHMDGEHCFRELRQLKPDVKVIMSSGYSESEVIQRFKGWGLTNFIQKPYKLSVLKDAIRKTRDQKAAS